MASSHRGTRDARFHVPSVALLPPLFEPVVTPEALERALESVVSEIIRITSKRPDGTLFKGLAKFLTGSLIDLVWLRTTDKLGYLAPMITAGINHRITIATLNYDNGSGLN
jgi:hypothetical protein